MTTSREGVEPIGEDDVNSRVEKGLSCEELLLINSLGVSGMLVGALRLEAGARMEASAIAVLREEALGKRASGSLARHLRITSARAGGMFGLMRVG